jgi:hypothetical protein
MRFEEAVPPKMSGSPMVKVMYRTAENNKGLFFDSLPALAITFRSKDNGVVKKAPLLKFS